MNTRLKLTIGALLLAAGCPFAASFAQSGSAVPVMAGGEAEYDACGALGEVTGANSADGKTLEVHSGPDAMFPAVDTLRPGAHVYLCEEKDEWMGVVYGDTDSGCGVSTPWPERKAYEGPCKAGWVPGTHVKIIAG